ncbi:fibronectin type III domain-containing protein [Niveibacterium sp. 24ML]|uniref:fibronectin type III domain-containing protein n=1 Tax=Niveibacterium sp. 24ML TaxID=2985512 RepID=UPI00226E0DF0|nr:fibronectin type III domain-containing protein [Niveibacterium sp. 24ML]MCX9156936.1 fibronectin type III domain-containing protein [Niveibacterium sp. 24ML]
MRTFIRHFLLSVMALLLIACGGGGGSTSTPAPTPSAPAAPTGLTAIATNGQVSLSWNVSSSATSYHLKRALVTGGAYTEIAAPTSTSYIDTGRTNGTAYYYVVTASNANGESANSTEVNATPSTDLPVLPESDNTKNYMGMNTWFLTDWDGSFAFVDAMKHARPWRNAAWNGNVATDAYEWPLADASTVIFTGSPEQINGTYKLVFKGQADVTLMWAGGLITNKVYDANTNTTTADVTYEISSTGSSGLVFSNTKRTATSAVNTGFADVRLYRPGYPADGSVVFTSNYVNALKKTGVIRLMDWGATNNNMTQFWADRITPAHMFKMTPTYTGPGGESWGGLDINGNANHNPGVAIEHQIQLCNQVHSDCWINIPPAASDDYVQKLALALRYGTDGTNPYTSYQAHPVYPPLAPDLRVYLEYSNEIWNTAYGFYGFRVILDIAKSLLTPSVQTNHPLVQFAPTPANVYQLVYCYPAYRLAAISDIFRAVYGDASMMNRIRPVLMNQQGNANDTLRLALNWIDGYARSRNREVRSYFYGAGGSAYYGSDATISEADRGNADLYFSGAYDTQGISAMGLDALWAASFGLKRIAYEGGPSLDYYTQQQADAINLDPRMKDMIVNTHNAWSAMGGDLLMYYTVVGPREWNFSNDISNSNTPKNQGLDQLNRQPRAAVMVGQALPGEVAYSATDSRAQITSGYWGYNTTCDALPCWAGMDKSGEWMALKAHSDNAFSGNLTVNALSSIGAVVRVYINGVSQGNVTLTASDHLSDSTSLPVAIPKGLVAVRLELVSGWLNLHSAKITP